MTDGPQGSSEEIIHLRAEPTPPLSLHPFLIKIRLLSKFGPLVIVLQAREAPAPHLGGRARKTDFSSHLLYHPHFSKVTVFLLSVLEMFANPLSGSGVPHGGNNSSEDGNKQKRTEACGSNLTDTEVSPSFRRSTRTACFSARISAVASKTAAMFILHKLIG